MRLLIDSIIAVILVVLFGAVVVHYRQEREEILHFQLVHRALSAMQEQALLHRALDQVEDNDANFPADIRPEWFDSGAPRNVLAPSQNPWLDIAPKTDRSDEPPDPVIHNRAQAGFWYNPSRGIFRARVAPQFTEAATLDLYNQLNGTALRALPQPADPYPVTHLAGKSSRAPSGLPATAQVEPPSAKRTLLDQDRLR
jgi:hypothetical protein